MRFHHKPIFTIRVPRSGLSYGDDNNSIYLWREAAHWAGGGSVTYWQDFCALDGVEQSAIVAHYLTHHQIEAVLAQDLEERRRRAARRARRRG